MNIRTSFDYPPIPIRSCDWSAYLPDYYDGAPDGGVFGSWIGHGETEQKAIDDLLLQIGDYIEERLAEETCFD